VKPMVFNDLNNRGQLDFIDLETQADGEFKFVFVYQDHSTKYVNLRALKSKRAEEVADQLLDVFLNYGAPCVLQSDNGRKFCRCGRNCILCVASPGIARAKGRLREQTRTLKYVVHLGGRS
jgi:hypothetical protein